MLLLAFFVILVIILIVDGLIKVLQHPKAFDNAVLEDPILAYHLDWNAIHKQKLLGYLFVKKINAIVRYQKLAGVSYEKANQAIEYVLSHPELLPNIPQKRRPALPEADDGRIYSLLETGELKQAAALYQVLADVDQFTAKAVIERIGREYYVRTIQDSDVQRLIVRDAEEQALTLLQERYNLTLREAIQAIDSIREHN